MPNQKQKGRLICVGVGITLGAHISPAARNYIEQADIVFSAPSDAFFEVWLSEMHPNVISLQDHYGESKSRKTTYFEMVDTILAPLAENKNVVVAFYGHPGVFVYPSHKAIERASALGYEAFMVPGISAEDCLYADLGIDPGKYGCQMYEASQFMFYKRHIDPSAYLILWQICIAGDLTHSIRTSEAEYLKIMQKLLYETYSPSHKAIIYEARTTDLGQVRKDEFTLQELTEIELSLHSTMVIPPSQKLKRNHLLISELSNGSSLKVISTQTEKR